MPTIQESICCKSIEGVDRKRTGVDEESQLSCITEHEGFKSVCLDRWVLEAAGYQVIQEHGALQGRNGPPHKFVCRINRTNLLIPAILNHILSIPTRCLRYIAYRQLVRWCWGYLGRDIRVVLPSCATNAIRRAFPSDSYTGFKLHAS